jgi:subfamily B ATP-binding cassette protein MsbA
MATPSDFTAYRRILVRLRPYRGEFVLALTCMVIFGATDGGIPFLVKYILDGVFSQQDKSLLYLLPVVLVVFACVRAVGDFGQQFLMSRVGQRIGRDLRNDLNRHLLAHSPEFFVRRSTADLLARITSDVQLVRTLLTDSVAAILRDSIRIVTLLIAAVYLDPVLALIALVVFPIGIYPVYRFGRKMRRLSKQGQDGVGTLSARLQESMGGNRIVKIFGRESFEIERFERENNELTDTLIKAERVRALSGPVNEVLASFAICGVILYGGFSVIGGVRSQGEFIAFLLSVFLLYDPFKKLSRIHSVVQQGMAGAERIFEIFDEQPAIVNPSMPVALGRSNTIRFSNVSYSYGRGDTLALRDINLTVPEGKKVALVGFSGSGKSTLVDLLPRFIAPQRGTVTIGDVDIARVDLKELRARIGLVGQHTFLFNDSVYNNIAYGHPGATRERIEAAARAAYADGFIQALPNGYETVVGEGGFALSGGERQRIAIARAILKEAPILILDEATASLDNRAEREVQSAIEALEKGKTSLIIAHRLSTIRDADVIVVMREGVIVEVGSHADLLQREGEYAKLHALQFRDPATVVDPDEVVIN